MPEQPSYVAYYGMKSDPFSEVADTPFVPVAGRQKAVDTLLHLLTYSEDVVFVAGPPGSGKSAILEQLVRNLHENIDLVMVDVREISSDKELLWELATQFYLQPDRTHSTQRLQLMLQAHCQSLHDAGQIPTLAVDDIDELPIDTLNGLAPVLHGGINGEPGLRLVGLASQPAEVRRELSALGFSSGQMIELPRFSLDDCFNLAQAYFASAGITAGVPLEPATMKRLHKLGGGLPGPFLAGVRDFMLVEAQRRRRQGKIPWPHLVAGAAVIAVLALAGLYQTGSDDPSDTELMPPSDTMEQAAQPADGAESVDEILAEAMGEETEDIDADSPIDPDLAEAEADAVRARLEEALAGRAAGEQDVEVDSPAADSGSAIPEELLAELESEESAPAEPEPEPAPEASLASDHALFAPDWLRNADSGRYTLQLLGAREESNVIQFAGAHNLNTDELGFVITELNDSPWYVLLYGTYADSDAARARIEELPADVQALSPWPRPVSGVQDTLD